MIRIIGTCCDPHEPYVRRHQLLLADGRWIFVSRERWYSADRALMARGSL